jgi:hypothetical protein
MNNNEYADWVIKEYGESAVAYCTGRGMKKVMVVMVLLAFSLTMSGQNDTIKKEKIKGDFQVSAANRNYFRGGLFGGGVAIFGTVEASYKGFAAGSTGIYSQDLSYNWGRGIDNYVMYTIKKKLSFSIHNYFFFNKDLSLSDPFYKTGHGSGKEGHYMEGIVKYSAKKFMVLAAYNFYNTTMEMYPSTVYLEGEYKFAKDFSFVAGFTTGPSVVNFYGDAYNNGVNFTFIGLNATRKIKDSELKAMMHVNPNYKNFDASLQQTPYTFILQFTL